MIKNRWSKFHDRKKKSIVFQLINRKWSIIDFWSESLQYAAWWWNGMTIMFMLQLSSCWTWGIAYKRFSVYVTHLKSHKTLPNAQNNVMRRQETLLIARDKVCHIRLVRMKLKWYGLGLTEILVVNKKHSLRKWI